MDERVHVTESDFTELEEEKKRLQNAAKEPSLSTRFMGSAEPTANERPEDDICFLLCCFECCFSCCTDNGDTDCVGSCFD